jgi:phenylacetic acid degradation operon negative regulatory protein
MYRDGWTDERREETGESGGGAVRAGEGKARPVRSGGVAAGRATAEDGAVRPQTLMLNLLGRYLLGRRTVVSAGSVIEVFARAGVGEHAARSTLARMVNRGMLTRQRHGRAMYFGLTAQAERILHDGEDRIWRSGAVNQDWDGYWTLLGFSLPESWQRQRHELRSQLTWAGFGPLFNGLWVAPGQVEVTRLVASLGLESRVKAFYAQAIPGTDIAKMVQENWDLDAVASRYHGFLSRWQGPDMPPRRRDPLAVQLLLASDWLQVIRADPRLPAEHLPADWPAAKAESLFVELDKTVAQPAGEIARQILDLRPTAETQA